MNSRQFNVDTVNAIVRSVSVITCGVARGHGLSVDDQTLREIKLCADARGRTPVKIDHSGGAGAVVGYLENFQIHDDRLTADWHLLQSHPQKDQILEAAQRMPEGVGLSAAFISPKDAEKGKARCSELISVDYVALPAANPNGLLSRATINGELVEFAAMPAPAVAGLGRGALGAIGRLRKAGIKIPPKLPAPLDGLKTRAKQVWNVNKGTIKRAAVGGLVDGAVVGGAVYIAGRVQRAQDEAEDRRAAHRARRRALSAQFAQVMLSRGEAIHRIIDAAKDNVPAYEEPAQVGVAKRVWRSDVVRAARLKLLKIAALTGGGAYVGHRILRKNGAKIGAGIGATAGVLLSRPSMNVTPNARESHTAVSLLHRLGTDATTLDALVNGGVLTPVSEVFHGDRADAPLAFDRGDLDAIALAVREEERPSTIGRIAKGAAVAGAVGVGASWLRGRSVLGAQAAKGVGVLGTTKAGFGQLRTDARELLKMGRARLAGLR